MKLRILISLLLAGILFPVKWGFAQEYGGIYATLQRVWTYEDHVYIMIAEEYASISCPSTEPNNIYRFPVSDSHAKLSLSLAMSAYAMGSKLQLKFRSSNCDAAGYVPIAGVGLIK